MARLLDTKLRIKKLPLAVDTEYGMGILGSMGPAMKNLVFLLLPLLLVFGVLIGLSLVLRLRYARERKRAQGPGSLLSAKPEDVVSVLGRLFQIVEVCPLSLPPGKGSGLA